MAIEKKGPTVTEVDLSHYVIDQEALSLVPATIAERYTLLPLFKVGRKLTIASSDPNNIIAIDQVRMASKMDVNVLKASAGAIKAAISEYYGIAPIVEDIIRRYPHPDEKKKALVSTTPEEAPIAELVNVFFSQAIKERASDIHIEPETKEVRIRTRVDGVLHEEISVPNYMLGPIVSRIKVLAGMDIAETRLPQDGRFAQKIDDSMVDFRVSTLPSANGEKMVLRLLDKSAMSYHLSDIGFNEVNLESFRKIIKKPHGIVLVSGPTGSGKTTTLYAVLGELNNDEVNITTIEDPIEYKLEGINQSQVNVKAGLTFANVLRSILRQDPDILLIGEIRDLETAEIAVQSALTGHLVFSTLHTNDSTSAVSRLEDMGVEPYLISSALEAVVAQRLVRKICNKCREEVAIPESYKEQYPALKKMYKGKGCKSCRNTGYKGRVGIFEMLTVDDEIKKLINAKKPAEEIRKFAIKEGMRTLFDDGVEKVEAGLTSLDEILRVTELE